MKRILLSAAGALLALQAVANYKAMEFTTSDGGTFTVGTDGLTITLENGDLKLTNEAGTEMTIAAESVLSMEFTDWADPDDGVCTPTIVPDGRVAAFDTSGMPAGEFESVADALGRLPEGVFILTNGAGNSLKVRVSR